MLMEHLDHEAEEVLAVKISSPIADRSLKSLKSTRKEADEIRIPEKYDRHVLL